jgi:hypothetical protein
MGTLLQPRVWDEITASAKSARSPAHVAVAFFADGAHLLLPVPAGSQLAVDASLSVVKSGATCPAALKKLMNRGVSIFSLSGLHAKMYSFDKIAYVGSANVSMRSRDVLAEAMLRVKDAPTRHAIRHAIEDLCITELRERDLDDLQKAYRAPKFASPDLVVEGSTLLMELTKEQGEVRVTQVQPPMGVWKYFFRLNPSEVKQLPTYELVWHSGENLTTFQRRVVSHHHNFTIELQGCEMPRPAILQIRRLRQYLFEYEVHRPSDPLFEARRRVLLSAFNPLQHPTGRRWVVL